MNLNFFVFLLKVLCLKGIFKNFKGGNHDVLQQFSGEWLTQIKLGLEGQSDSYIKRPLFHFFSFHLFFFLLNTTYSPLSSFLYIHLFSCGEKSSTLRQP